MEIPSQQTIAMYEKHIIHFIPSGHKVTNSYNHCFRYHSGQKCVLVEKKIEVVPDSEGWWARRGDWGDGYAPHLG